MISRRRNFRLAAEVEGFLTDREGQLLYALANRCQGRGSIVEIGSWKGKSTIWLAQGVRDAASKESVYAIDPHIGSEEHQKFDGKVWTFDDFKKNIDRAGLNDFVVPVVATSREARKSFTRPVELLFIDGAHDYDSVMLDFGLWFPLLVPGGWVAFHDIPWPGVRKATREIFSQNGLDRFYFADTLMVARKAGQVSLKERWKNDVMLWANDRFQNACSGNRPRNVRSIDKAWAKFIRDCVYLL